jgi:hypothetical protein
MATKRQIRRKQCADKIRYRTIEDAYPCTLGPGKNIRKNTSQRLPMPILPRLARRTSETQTTNPQKLQTYLNYL